MPTFYALTSTNPAAGYDIIAVASDRATAQQRADAALTGDRTRDIYLDTQLKNLVVVSRTTALRRYGVGEGTIEQFLNA